MKRPKGTSDPTIELTDSQVVPMSTTRKAPEKAPKGDVSLWRGEVVASEDFAPTRPKRRLRAWVLVLIFAALGVGAGAVVVALKGDKDAKPAAGGVGTAGSGSGTAVGSGT